MTNPSDPGMFSWNRRSFLWSLAGLGISTKMLKGEKPSDATYRLRTPEGEVRMSVRSYAAPIAGNFMFRDDLTARPFCLSAEGEQDRNCVERFVGSMAI